MQSSERIKWLSLKGETKLLSSLQKLTDFFLHPMKQISIRLKNRNKKNQSKIPSHNFTVQVVQNICLYNNMIKWNLIKFLISVPMILSLLQEFWQNLSIEFQIHEIITKMWTKIWWRQNREKISVYSQNFYRIICVWYNLVIVLCNWKWRIFISGKKKQQKMKINKWVSEIKDVVKPTIASGCLSASPVVALRCRAARLRVRGACARQHARWPMPWFRTPSRSQPPHGLGDSAGIARVHLSVHPPFH